MRNGPQMANQQTETISGPLPGVAGKLLVHLLVFAAFESMLYFSVWWFSPEHAKHWLLFIPLSIATFWLFYESFIYWFYLLGMKAPEPKEAPPNLSVDVYTTAAPGEPPEMFASSLPALQAIKTPHARSTRSVS